MPEMFIHTRLRRSPYHEATVAAGAVAFGPYNRMLMPLSYGRAEEDYRRLVEGVAMWDVAGQRQIELRGPDAARLAQVLCPRDLSRCVEGQGKYVALCDHAGAIINDPIVMKVAEDCFWLSIADADIALWARGIAAERGLDVVVRDADVSPMAVQGPMAEEVVATIFGDWVREMRYFWFADAEVDGIPLKLARSGWSKQGGFELYLMDEWRGLDLWNIVAEAGRPWGIAAGNPNPSERIENGLLSWGGDTDRTTNPFEVGLRRFVDLDVPDDVIGIHALRRIAAQGPTRHQLGVVLADGDPKPGHERWYDIIAGGNKVGDMTNGTWSYKLGRNIGFGLVSVECEAGDDVEVDRGGELIGAKLVEIPFRSDPFMPEGR